MDSLIVGLGNPGKEYNETRHNVGFMAIERFANEQGVSINRIRFQATTAELFAENKKILLMKPQTFMNRSGDAVAAACDYYQIPVEQVIVLCDDVTLPFGRLRIRTKGSAGGHNGLKSLIQQLGSDQFIRVRIGVSDRCDANTSLADWVLGKFSGTDKTKLEKRFSDISHLLTLLIRGETEAAMTRYNGDIS